MSSTSGTIRDTVRDTVRETARDAKDAVRESGNAASAASGDIQADLQALRDDVTRLASQLTEIFTAKGNAAWARATVPQIAWESWRLAKKRAYRGIPFQDFCDKNAKGGKATDLTDSYEAAGARTVEEQLMKAGVRLAALLERTMTK